MRAPSIDIADLLEGETSLGLSIAGNLFVSEMPEKAGLVVSVYDSGGMPQEVNYSYKRPNVQVRVRGAVGKYEDAYNMAQDIQDFLLAQRRPVVNGSLYIGIWALSDVQFVGYDESHRPLVTVNFRMDRTEHP